MKAHPAAQTKKRANYTNTIGVCRICGAYCDYLPTHLRYAHHIEFEDYIQQYCESNDPELQRWNQIAIGKPALKPGLGY